MAINLPDDLADKITASPTLIDFGGVQQPAFGGPDQALIRLGMRFAVTFVLPVLPVELAAKWIARRNKSIATKTPLSMLFPQPALGRTGFAPGAPVVDGAGQTGVILNVKGLNAGTILREGQFFCFSKNGRSYLHQVTDAVIADSAGKAAVSIAPMLRVSPADGATMNMTEPRIEGFATGSSADWSIERMARVSLSFTIREVE